MSGIKITELPASTTPLSGSEIVPLVQGGVTKRATVTQIGTVTATGATTPRTLPDRFADTISVKDFGAVGDGVTDDTAAINAWLTYIVANDKIGSVPAGVYRFTSALSGGVGSNWGIVGAGSAAVTFLYDGNNTTNDLWTVGNGSTEIINVCLSGFTVRSNTTMTSGVGLRLRLLCRSSLSDVVIDGQDGNGKLWYGIRFDCVDMVTYSGFQCRAQKDGLQVNGTVGTGPKAGLFVSGYKIASCDVGVRIGGAFGGVYFGEGDIIANADGVVIDTTIAAEANREVFFSPLVSIDTCGRCGVKIDQALSSQLWVNFPSKMWIASTASHGIWIKNAAGAKINIDAYIYNTTGDGIRLDDTTTFVSVNSFFNGINSAGTYAVNPTVATSLLSLGTECRFENVGSIFNFASNRAVNNLPLPLSVQYGRAVLWDTFSATLDGSGNGLIAHGKGGDYYKKIIAVFVSAKETGNAWYPLTQVYVDGTNIGITGGASFASRPCNVMCLIGDQNNVGW